MPFGIRVDDISPSAEDLVNQIMAGAADELQKTTEEHVKRRQDIVRFWSNRTRPRWSSKFKWSDFIIQWDIQLQEKGKPYWTWIDETGTRPHLIRARNAPRLAWRTGGSPKTRANPPRFGPGRPANGPWAFAKVVRHPGFKPRRFSDMINKDMGKAEVNAIIVGSARGS